MISFLPPDAPLYTQSPFKSQSSVLYSSDRSIDTQTERDEYIHLSIHPYLLTYLNGSKRTSLPERFDDMLYPPPCIHPYIQPTFIHLSTYLNGSKSTSLPESFDDMLYPPMTFTHCSRRPLDSSHLHAWMDEWMGERTEGQTDRRIERQGCDSSTVYIFLGIYFMREPQISRVHFSLSLKETSTHSSTHPSINLPT